MGKQFIDYYKVLGVSKNSTHSQIRKAYYSFAKKCHPDCASFEDNIDNFRKYNEAYEILGDNEKRKKYDKVHSLYTKQKDNSCYFFNSNNSTKQNEKEENIDEIVRTTLKSKIKQCQRDALFVKKHKKVMDNVEEISDIAKEYSFNVEPYLKDIGRAMVDECRRFAYGDDVSYRKIEDVLYNIEYIGTEFEICVDKDLANVASKNIERLYDEAKKMTEQTSRHTHIAKNFIVPMQELGHKYNVDVVPKIRQLGANMIEEWREDCLNRVQYVHLNKQLMNIIKKNVKMIKNIGDFCQLETEQYISEIKESIISSLDKVA